MIIIIKYLYNFNKYCFFFSSFFSYILLLFLYFIRINNKIQMNKFINFNKEGGLEKKIKTKIIFKITPIFTVDKISIFYV